LSLQTIIPRIVKFSPDHPDQIWFHFFLDQFPFIVKRFEPTLVILTLQQGNIPLITLTDLLESLVLPIFDPVCPSHRHFPPLHIVAEVSPPQHIRVHPQLLNLNPFLKASQLPQHSTRFTFGLVRHPRLQEELENLDSIPEKIHLQEQVDYNLRIRR